MSVQRKQGRPPGPRRRFRLLPARGESVTLLGMLLCICSLFLFWPVPLNGYPVAPALVINLTRTGGAIDAVRWPVMAAAILCGLLLVYSAPSSARAPLTFVQALCGLICLIIALLHFAIQPGPLVDLLGGSLLTAGSVDRAARQSGGER